MNLQANVLNNLHKFIAKLVMKYVQKNKIKIKNLQEYIHSGIDVLKSKFKGIITAIFLANRKKFFLIMRKELGRDEQTLDTWENIQK